MLCQATLDCSSHGPFQVMGWPRVMGTTDPAAKPSRIQSRLPSMGFPANRCPLGPRNEGRRLSARGHGMAQKLDFGANKRPASVPTWRNLSGMAFERGKKPSAAAVLPADRHQGPPNWSLCGRSGFWGALCRTAECSSTKWRQLGGRMVWWAGFGPVESGRSVGL